VEGFNLFNIGFGELTFILIMAGLVMGPQRIRQVARYLGMLTARLQRISREFTQQLNAELDAVERGEFSDALADLRSLQKEVADLRRELMAAPQQLRKEGEAALNGPLPAAEKARKSDPGSAEIENTIGPAPGDIANLSASDLPRPLDVEDDPA
jgi:Sec-independent protein translocase protein TatA